MPNLRPVSTTLPAHPVFDAPPTRFIDVGHSQLAHRAVGSGPDLLLIHGWPVHMATWRYLVSDLAADFTCHCIDLPGAGETRFGKDAPIELFSHAETARRAVDALGLECYGIVAFDSGAAVARYLAADDARVKALVISGTEIPGHHPDLVALIQRFARWPGFDRWMRTLFSFRAVQRSKFGFAGCFADPSRIDDDFARRFIAPLTGSAHLMWGAMELARNLTPAMTDDLRHVHPKLTMPVQLIWGTKDPFFPVERARAMATHIPGARFDTIEGGRLMVHEEFADIYAKLARRALDLGLRDKKAA